MFLWSFNIIPTLLDILVFAGGSTEEPFDVPVTGEDVITHFKISSPPDPNIIPIAVLAAKPQEWMPGKRQRLSLFRVVILVR